MTESGQRFFQIVSGMMVWGQNAADPAEKQENNSNIE